MTDAQIVAYLDGRMSPAEKQQFETELQKNEALRTQLEAEQAARSAVYLLQQSAIKQQLQSGPPPGGTSSNRRLWGWLGLAVLFLLLGIGLIRHQVSPARLYSEQVDCICEQLNPDTRNRGQEGPRSLPPQNSIAVDYCDLMEQGKYGEAIRLLEAKIQGTPPESDARIELTYALAIAYAQSGDTPQANQLMSTVMTHNYDFQPEAQATRATLNGFWHQLFFGSESP